MPIALGEVVHFDTSWCTACPQRAQCSKAPSGRGRSLSIAHEEGAQHKLIELAPTPKGRAPLREHVAVKDALAPHARVQGLQIRYRGTGMNLFEVRRTAVVLNLESAARSLAHAA